jgi:hypothetical protein
MILKTFPQIDWDKYKKVEGIEEELDQYRKVKWRPPILMPQARLA